MYGLSACISSSDGTASGLWTVLDQSLGASSYLEAWTQSQLGRRAARILFQHLQEKRKQTQTTVSTQSSMKEAPNWPCTNPQHLPHNYQWFFSPSLNLPSTDYKPTLYLSTRKRTDGLSSKVSFRSGSPTCLGCTAQSVGPLRGFTPHADANTFLTWILNLPGTCKGGHHMLRASS